MKFAIIADIHANLEALQVVLEDTQQQKCTHYACVGDVVGYNANPSLLEVVGYALYWLVILLGIRWGTERLAARLASERSRL